MQMTLDINGRLYGVALARPHNLAIPVRFEGAQLSVFGTPPARRETVKGGDFTGSVAAGGSCNCETYTLIPHCNGTHTECIGHITGASVSVHDMLKDSLIPATLVTVSPSATAEAYDPVPEAGDLLITRTALEAALQAAVPGFTQALIIRTLPNGTDKMTRDYNSAMPPYFSNAAMRLIRERGVEHLLVDMPSVDRLADKGRLSNHRIFWDVPAGDIKGKPSPRTVTELIYAPPALSDGPYLLNLQIAAFEADAAPSRPVLYEVTPR